MDSFPLVHLGVTSNNELKLCIIPILADSSDPDPTSRNGFLKKLQVSDPLKKFAAKNNLKLKLGKNSTAVSSQKDWWKKTSGKITELIRRCMNLARGFG